MLVLAYAINQGAATQLLAPDAVTSFFDLLGSPVGSVVFGGTFLVLLVSIASLSWGLFKYGAEIKKLNEFETMTRLASLAGKMEEMVKSHGDVSLKLVIFSKKLDDTQDRVATLMSRLNAVESLIETRQPPRGENLVPIQVQGQRSLNDAADIENWASIQGSWREVRDAIESSIEKLHGLARKKYSDAPRYSYAEIIKWLEADKVLSRDGALCAQNMNKLFLSTRPRNAVIDPSDVERFNRWKSRVLLELKRFKANPKTLRQLDEVNDPFASEEQNPANGDELLQRDEQPPDAR